jgi:hypothetical protein
MSMTKYSDPRNYDHYTRHERSEKHIRSDAASYPPGTDTSKYSLYAPGNISVHSIKRYAEHSNKEMKRQDLGIAQRRF